MKKILLIGGYPDYGVGGVETYWNNLLTHMDLGNYDIDFLTFGSIVGEIKANELRSLGIRLLAFNLSTPQGRDSLIEKLEFYIQVAKKLKVLCRKKQYDIVHINAGVKLYQANLLFFSRIYGIQRRIAHSHNATPKKSVLRTCLSKFIVWNATDLLACSYAAAESLFGKKAAKKAVIMKNGIDTKKFAYDRAMREVCRQKLGIEKEDFVIGHVGRFEEQKNHAFLLKVFSEVLKDYSTAKLLLIGEGSLGDDIHRVVEQLGLENNVIFAGVTNEVEKYYCAMDIFVLPSLFEGLPIVGIEAQASGLPCFFSNRITTEVKVTEPVQFLPLQDVMIWKEQILKVREDSFDRADSWRRVCEAGYDSSESARRMMELYGSENLCPEQKVQSKT